jgi:hypothetical protein
VIQFDNLAQLADELRKLGYDAAYEVVYCASAGAMEGLDIGDDFFPVWELSLPENSEALANLDFESIKARRSPEWGIIPPPLAAGQS